MVTFGHFWDPEWPQIAPFPDSGRPVRILRVGGTESQILVGRSSNVAPGTTLACAGEAHYGPEHHNIEVYFGTSAHNGQNEGPGRRLRVPARHWKPERPPMAREMAGTASEWP